jgi:hypothetical protein
MCTSVVSEEQILVFSIHLAVLSELRVLKQEPLCWSLEVLTSLSKKQFLIVCIVEDMGVHSPSAFEATSRFVSESNGVRPHYCHKVLIC